MKKVAREFIFLLIFSAIFLTFHCKPKTSDQGVPKPQPPILVPKTSEIAGEEKGIDAVPEADAIFLEWFSSKDETIRNWKVFRGTAERGFQLVATLVAADTSFLDEHVQIGVRYLYFLTTVNARGMESAPSDTVSYKLLPKALNLSNTLSVQPDFSWHFVGVPPVLYVLRLYRNPGQELVWLSRITPSYAASEETRFNWDGTALVNSLARGASYFWRVDEIGTEANSGSESNWKIFTVP